MKSSVALTVAVIAVVACLGYSYLVYYEVDNTEDYTLLASTDYFEGLTIEVVSEGYSEGYKTTVVKEVSGNDVTLGIEAEEEQLTSVGFYYYTPGMALPFDYTDPEAIPEGITIDIDENLYIINGSFEETQSRTWSFDDLWIIYDGEEVSYVDGLYFATIDSEYEGSQIYMETVYEVWTDEDEVQMYCYLTMDVTGTVDKESVLHEALPTFDRDRFYDYNIEVKSGKLGGLDVKIYTLNGDYYKDFKFYVYNDHILKAYGTVIENGIEYDYSIDVKVYLQFL